MAEELKRNIRNEQEFQAWVRSQELDGLLTQQQKQTMRNALNNILSVFGKGTTTLIEASAKSIGGGLV